MRNSISKKQLRDFGLIVGLSFPIIFGLILPAYKGHDFKIWTLIVGISLISLGLLQPFLLFYPYQVWMKIGHILGWFNSRIILGLIFILVLQPISILMKLFNYDPLKQTKKNTSYRENTSNKIINLNRIF